MPDSAWWPQPISPEAGVPIGTMAIRGLLVDIDGVSSGSNASPDAAGWAT